MHKYISIISLVIFGMGCSGKAPQQDNPAEIINFSLKDIHPLLYYIIEVRNHKASNYTAIVEGNELIQLINNKAIDTFFVAEAKTILEINKAQFDEKFKIDFESVNLILKEGSKQSFLNTYAPRGFIKGFNNEMENAIIYVAIKKWKFTCLKDDETGFVVITK